MKTLYWRKYPRTGPFGVTEWVLLDKQPGCHDRIATIRKTKASLAYSGGVSARFGTFKSLATARKQLEREISRKSIALFNDDDVEFVNE